MIPKSFCQQHSTERTGDIMEITIIPTSQNSSHLSSDTLGKETIQELSIASRHIISLTIRSFKGRRNVELFLFKADYSDTLLDKLRLFPLVGEPIDPNNPGDPDDALRSILESFTEKERDDVLQYLSQRYAENITSAFACPLETPVPQGIRSLASIPEGKNLGFVYFERAPNYPLPFRLRGFYDLEQHEPLVAERE